jgi:hypothetical protein
MVPQSVSKYLTKKWENGITRIIPVSKIPGRGNSNGDGNKKESMENPSSFKSNAKGY